MADIKALIDAADRKFGACFGAADFEGLSNLYTEDCKLMPTGSPLIEGRAGVAKVFESVYGSGFIKVTLCASEIGTAGGDVIYSRGVYTFYLADGSVADVGKYVVLWKRLNDQVQMYTDIFNTDKS